MALQETVKKADLVALGTRLAAGLAAGAWSVPTLILTGDADKYIQVLGKDGNKFELKLAFMIQMLPLIFELNKQRRWIEHGKLGNAWKR